MFVQTAQQFDCDIRVTHGDREANARSILNVLTLGAEQGAEITIRAQGLDEFSMNPPAIPLAKQIIRAVTLEQAQRLALAALELDDPDAVQSLVWERVPAADLA